MEISLLGETSSGIVELIELMKKTDTDFNPPLSTRVESFEIYVKKLLQHGHIHVASNHNKIIGAIGYYCNNYEKKVGYISYLSVHKKYRGKGISFMLLNACVGVMKLANMNHIIVRTDLSNIQAIKFYTNCGFQLVKNMIPNIDQSKKIYYELTIS